MRSLSSTTFLLGAGVAAAAAPLLLAGRPPTAASLVALPLGAALVYAALRLVPRPREAQAVPSEALLVTERRALAGLLATSVAHDFNNVLAIINTGIAVLRDAPTAGERTTVLDQMDTAVARGTDLAWRLGRAGRDVEQGERREVDVLATVLEAVEVVRLHKRAQGCDLRVLADAPLRANVYPTLVHQVVTHLVLGAVDAVRGRGRIEVRIVAAGAGAAIEVHDDGPLADGDPERAMGREPGTGLGLLPVRTCAALHDGGVEVDRSALGGACVRVRLAA
jgi:two-component system sensor histidine kinase HydH